MEKFFSPSVSQSLIPFDSPLKTERLRVDCAFRLLTISPLQGLGLPASAAVESCDLGSLSCSGRV
jgi:hypothetical protein